MNNDDKTTLWIGIAIGVVVLGIFCLLACGLLGAVFFFGGVRMPIP